MKNILFAFLLGLLSIVPLSAQQKVNGGMAIGGPDPWQDLQAYGSIRCGYDGICEVLGNTVSGSTSVTLTGPVINQGYIRYPNGAGIAIPGAGANNLQTTPAAPSVVPEMVTGSTTYQYVCVGIDANEALTAASPVTIITNGDANLGNNGKVATVSTISRDATGLITVTTVAAHGFVYNDPFALGPQAGTIVSIAGVSDGSFNGEFVVMSSSGSTFTAMSGIRSVATSSGGTATVFGFNRVTCPALSGTTVQYLVFGRTSGSMVKVGRTQRDDNVLYDYGAMYNNELYPDWYPTTVPSAPTKGILSTTVVSGGGTSSLVIATPANATLTGAEIQYDDGPAIRKAISVSCAFVGCTSYWNNTIFFSPLNHGLGIATDFYIINSPVTIPRGINVVFDNAVIANEPITLSAENTVRGIANGPGPQFGQQGYTSIVGNAHPQILQHSGSATLIEGISTNSIDIGGLGFTGQFTLRNSALVSDGSDTRIPLILGGPNNVDMLQLSDITFYSADLQTVSTNPEPPLIPNVWLRCSFAGLSVKGNGNNLTGRGILFDNRQNSNCPSGIGTADIEFDMGHGVSEVPTNPLISVYGHTQGATNIVLRNAANTDASQPYVALWTNVSTNIYFENLRSMPSCGVLSSYKTGFWANSITIVNSGASNHACIGQNTSVSIQDQGGITDLGADVNNVPVTIGQLDESQPVVLSGPTPPPAMWTYSTPALTCSVVAGGAVSIDTITYYLYVIGYNNGESSLSRAGSCVVTTTSGNQTVNFSWAPVPGAKAYLIHKVTNAGFSNRVGACHGITTTSCSDAFVGGDGTSQTAAALPGTGLPLIDSTQVVTPKLVLPVMGGSVAGIHIDLTGAADGSLQCAFNGGSPSGCVTGTRSFGTTFGDTGGTNLTSGSIVYMTIPYACTIAAWNMTADTGTATVDIWKIGTGTAIPTIANTITASALPALSTGTAIHSTVLTGWTTAVAVNDIIAFQLKTVATARFVEIDLQCNQ
jgi:hypothetical protein